MALEVELHDTQKVAKDSENWMLLGRWIWDPECITSKLVLGGWYKWEEEYLKLMQLLTETGLTIPLERFESDCACYTRCQDLAPYCRKPFLGGYDNLNQLGINRFEHRVHFAVQIIALVHSPHFRPNFVCPQKKNFKTPINFKIAISN